MPLPLLGALVVFGIGGLVLLIHLFGWTRQPAFADKDEAAQALLTDYPHAVIQNAGLADERRSALFVLPNAIGYAAPFGDGRLTRVIEVSDLKSVDAAGDGLTLRLTDYTAPRLSVAMRDPTARETWRRRLARLGGENDS